MYGADASLGVRQELVQGYRSKLLRNYSPFPSYLHSLMGLANLGIWGEIRRVKPDVAVVMSWINRTWWLAVLTCIRSRIPFLYIADANGNAEGNRID